MATPFAHLQPRLHHDWLIGIDSQSFAQQVEWRSQQLTRLQTEVPAGVVSRVLLAESDPVSFLAGFMAACMAECAVFLANPDWAEAEWQEVGQLVQPHWVWSDRPSTQSIENYLQRQLSLAIPTPTQPGWIMIPTGGSSGNIRFAIHTWDTLMASIQGFQHHFQVQQVHSCCVLPLYHVSGLMQFLRSLTTGGQFALSPFKSLKNGVIPLFDPTHFFVSLVPTQLQQLLQNPELTDWLKQFQTVLLGGAPASLHLLKQARQQGIRLAPTYGMTETASQVATLLPQKFLSGHTSSGTILPHAQITILDSKHQPDVPNQIGTVAIQAQSLSLGYYPDLSNSPGYFLTDDLGFLDSNGELNIVGRNSEKIITGGENVFPVEVESAIFLTGLVVDVCVVGMPDSHWGEVVTAIYIPQHPEIHDAEIQAAIAPQLSKFKHPKRWISVSEIPRNQQGKINRKQLVGQWVPIP